MLSPSTSNRSFFQVTAEQSSSKKTRFILNGLNKMDEYPETKKKNTIEVGRKDTIKL